jgi:hypothetical protein
MPGVPNLFLIYKCGKHFPVSISNSKSIFRNDFSILTQADVNINISQSDERFYGSLRTPAKFTLFVAELSAGG